MFLIKPHNLHLQNYYSSLGIDTCKPSFSWQLEGDGRAEQQTHYRIVVAQREEALELSEEAVWDTGKVESANQLGIAYEGNQLTSITGYFWKVAVWDQDGQVSWSEAQFFYTGYLHGECWRAAWIGTGKNKPFYARSEFKIDKPVKRAFALVSGLGHFKLYMNGSKIGNHEMDPGWTNYRESIQYVGFECTDQIRDGLNAIGLSIGNGFYSGDPGGRHFYTMDKGYEPYGTELMVIGELHIEYEDGTKAHICTSDEGWTVRDSATTLANVYGSENFDARLYPAGWNDLGFNDSGWEHAVCLIPPTGSLRYQNQPPIVVKHIYDTVLIEEPREQVYVFDLGQNMSGMFEIYVSGPAGSKVTIKPGELRKEDDTVATPWDIVTYSEYTLAGTGEVEVWKPDFSCYGARWVQIEGCTRDIADRSKPFIHDVKGHFVTSASMDAGELETDDPRITKLAQIILKAIESNLQSVHSDCPTIEKLGWIETAHLMGPSIMYVKHVDELWLKITRDMIEAQTEEGLIPDIAPEYSKFEGPFRDSIAWGSSIVIVPELLLQTYGNRTAIIEAYPSMKRYMGYLKTKETQDGLIGHGLGDWGIAPQTGGDYIENVETAIYFYDYELMAKYAEMLGYPEDAAHYSSEAERIKSNYNRLLLKSINGEQYFAYFKQDGTHDPVNQVIQAIPLFFDLVPEQHHQDIEAALLQAASSNQLLSGEIGLRYLFGALAGMKRNDIVYQMMMQPEHPSYIRFVEKGETALPEFWTDDARSRNHDMMGHILEWLYKDLLGISSRKDAYKEINIAPLYSTSVRQIKGRYKSVRGLIEVEFSHNSNGSQLNVLIPPNTTAFVKVPLNSSNEELFENGQRLDYKLVIEEGINYALVSIQSGKYLFNTTGNR
ncbi:family 78 glycoside hydrolase catalytic domain [Paenibacillus sp. YAF4_2]|uniref:family 78 glycoside hydrolase catalytic domain n=1 Tax=Paenibacillus sp. YAF4_2 TaxID=3233085 RepID=UPI003F9D8F86